MSPSSFSRSLDTQQSRSSQGVLQAESFISSHLFPTHLCSPSLGLWWGGTDKSLVFVILRNWHLDIKYAKILNTGISFSSFLFPPNNNPNVGIFLYIFYLPEDSDNSGVWYEQPAQRICKGGSWSRRKEFCSRNPHHSHHFALAIAGPHPKPMQDFTAQMKCSKSAHQTHLFSLLDVLLQLCFDDPHVSFFFPPHSSLVLVPVWLRKPTVLLWRTRSVYDVWRSIRRWRRGGENFIVLMIMELVNFAEKAVLKFEKYPILLGKSCLLDTLGCPSESCPLSLTDVYLCSERQAAHL